MLINSYIIFIFSYVHCLNRLKLSERPIIFMFKGRGIMFSSVDLFTKSGISYFRQPKNGISSTSKYELFNIIIHICYARLERLLYSECEAIQSPYLDFCVGL